MIFKATRPGCWLRDDLADILTALAASGLDIPTLCAVALALGLRPAAEAPRVVVQVNGWEVIS